MHTSGVVGVVGVAGESGLTSTEPLGDLEPETERL